MNRKNVLILGTGVAGLTTARRLLQAGYQVTLWSKEPDGQFPETSLNAYAMWVPVASEADPRLFAWANESFAVFEALSRDPATGVTMPPTFVLKTSVEEPWYAGKVPGFRHALPGELPDGYADAHVLAAAPVIDPRTYLPWLRQQVVAGGAHFEQKTVSSLASCPDEFDVVINCTGLAARDLTNDGTIYAESIQVVTVPNVIGLNRVIIDNDGPNARACIVPHASYIKLGGVIHEHDESREVDPAATLDILTRCNRLVPGLNATLADVQSVVRAVRAERPTIRVELERLPDGPFVIHNYAHDGMGYLTSHGIADEILRCVEAL